jgi:hypothetical protein
MKKFVSYGAAIAAAATMLSMSGIAGAAAPRPHRPDVVSATPDTYNASWVTGVSQDGGPKGQSIKLGDGGDFAYYSFRNWWDQKVSSITKIRASFMAAVGTVNTAGSPRISLELDADANGAFDLDDGYQVGDMDVVIYLDPSTCSDPAANGSGWREADFTGDRTNCVIYDSTGASYASDATGTAWSKIAATYPNAKVWFAFLIQDASTGVNYVDRIMLDSALFTSAK